MTFQLGTPIWRRAPEGPRCRNWDCQIGEPAKYSSFIVHLREGCYSGNTPRRPSGRNPSGRFQKALFPPHVPTINIADDGNPPDANPPETSTPIKATPESGKRHSKKKLNLFKIEATHLIFNLRDWQEKARKSVESEGQAAVPDPDLQWGARFRWRAPSWTSSNITWSARERQDAYPYPRTRLRRLSNGITSTSWWWWWNHGSSRRRQAGRTSKEEKEEKEK